MAEMKKQDTAAQAAATEAAVASLTFDQLKELLGGAKRTEDDPLAAAILKLVQDNTRGTRPENAVNPGISAFSHPEGEAVRPKAKLTRETYFCGSKQSEEQLTPLEIDLFNSITESKVARQGAWTADVEAPRMGGRGRLLVHIPARTADDMAGAFALPAILTELSTGQDATDIGKILTELAELRSKVDKVKTGETALVGA